MGEANPKAWVLVPVDPTTEMVGAATRVDFDNEDEVAMTINLWHAMVAAATLPASGFEPPLSCPALDRFISATNPPAEALADIAAVRHINSQLRYGLWHEKTRADEAEFRALSLEEEVKRLTAERDAASADAYKANKAADAINAALKETGERAAKNWRDFRDLRIEITGDGPMCRDCADENGRCPHSGQPCDPDEAVKEQIAKWKAEGFRDKIALGATAEEILRFRDGYPNPAGGSKIFYRYTIEQARYRYADAVIAARSTAPKEKAQ